MVCKCQQNPNSKWWPCYQLLSTFVYFLCIPTHESRMLFRWQQTQSNCHWPHLWDRMNVCWSVIEQRRGSYFPKSYNKQKMASQKKKKKTTGAWCSREIDFLILLKFIHLSHQNALGHYTTLLYLTGKKDISVFAINFADA